MNIEPIAYIHTDLPTKFGLPRQSGIIEELKGRIVFEPPFRDPQAVKGLEGYSHIWVLWDFSRAHRNKWSATVCPPRLGGKVHMGVFATRSPFRPNSIGLSSLRLDGIETGDKGPVLYVSGIDMMDGTPVYDIKPYIPEYDSHPEAKGGFTEEIEDTDFEVSDPGGLILSSGLNEDDDRAIKRILKNDPRPRFDLEGEGNSDRIYGFYYKDLDVRFRVDGSRIIITEIVKAGR